MTHVFSATGPFRQLSVAVDGEVETHSTDGVVRGTVERFPPSLFLRETPLTQADAAIAKLAEEVRGAGGGADTCQPARVAGTVCTARWLTISR